MAETGQTFGWAVEQMRDGACVQREGWNGKGMYIYLESGLGVSVRGPGGSEVRGVEPFIVMFTTQGKHQPGWLASQADILATDWRRAP